MDHLNKEEDSLPSQNLPPYSEKQPYDQQPLLANPVMPAQYASYGAVPSRGPLVQPSLHTTVVPVQPTHTPDHLGYSIFTMLCCCLPLGIVALIYSIRTRDSNNTGNATEAQQNSKMALIFSHLALGAGIVMLIVSIVLIVVMFENAQKYLPTKMPPLSSV